MSRHYIPLLVVLVSFATAIQVRPLPIVHEKNRTPINTDNMACERATLSSSIPCLQFWIGVSMCALWSHRCMAVALVVEARYAVVIAKLTYLHEDGRFQVFWHQNLVHSVYRDFWREPIYLLYTSAATALGKLSTCGRVIDLLHYCKVPNHPIHRLVHFGNNDVIAGCLAARL